MTGSAQRRDQTLAVDYLIAPQGNTLIIGSVDRWYAEGRMKQELDEFQFADLEALSGDFLQELNPEIVFSPLFADSFDALDVARALHASQFQGCYRVISGQLPNTRMIKTEIAQIAPGLDFDILVVPEKPQAD